MHLVTKRRLYGAPRGQRCPQRFHGAEQPQTRRGTGEHTSASKGGLQLAAPPELCDTVPNSRWPLSREGAEQGRRRARAGWRGTNCNLATAARPCSGRAAVDVMRAEGNA